MIEINVKEWQAVRDVKSNGGNFPRQVGPFLVRAEAHKDPVQTNFGHAVEKRTQKKARIVKMTKCKSEHE